MTGLGTETCLFSGLQADVLVGCAGLVSVGDVAVDQHCWMRGLVLRKQSRSRTVWEGEDVDGRSYV